VEQGKVLHNYASILELLLRLRQCCDHPFLVMRLVCGSIIISILFSTCLSAKKKTGPKWEQIVSSNIWHLVSYLIYSFTIGLLWWWSFVVISRGDTQEFADLNKLAKRFLHGGNNSANGDSSSLPSKAYIEEVVQELRKGEGECPICLEAFEDAVLTPCAHRLCRECIFSSWQSPAAGLCPVCR
jgi:hypothetical protein